MTPQELADRAMEGFNEDWSWFDIHSRVSSAIRAAEEEATKREREACAKIAEWWNTPAAAAIRARGQEGVQPINERDDPEDFM